MCSSNRPGAVAGQWVNDTYNLTWLFFAFLCRFRVDHPGKKVLNLKGAFQRTFNRPLSRFLLQNLLSGLLNVLSFLCVCVKFHVSFTHLRITAVVCLCHLCLDQVYFFSFVLLWFRLMFQFRQRLHISNRTVFSWTDSRSANSLVLVLWRHCMLLSYTHPVTSENQFHCTTGCTWYNRSFAYFTSELI